MPDAGYWDARAARYGHTGWSDWVIYSFDQFARLAAVRAVLESLDAPRHGRALDYGTGTGDFARMLSKRYEQVVAIDISHTVLDIARKRHAGRTNIEFRHVDAERKLPSESVDFVLTVTVLNHIMDDASLRATMESLANALAPGGCFVALEGCVDANTAGRSTYQRNQTHDEWRAMFERCGLVAEDCFGFYHPTADRCRSFDRYAESLPVRLLRWMGPSGITTRALGAVAALYLLGRRDYLWRAKPTDALRLMIFRRPAVGKSNGAHPSGVVATPDEPWLRHAHAPREPESTNEPCACVNYSLAMDFTTEHPIASAPALRIRPGG